MKQAASLSLPAPAKLNLMLHVVGRRADGYNELQPLFQFLDLADQLHFRVRDDGQLLLHSELAGVASADNLIMRAARLLQQNSNCRLGADIWLDKHLPVGGGIGGGSSNAATCLLGLNHLWQLGLDLEQLAALGLRLGADVPVFIHGRAAFAEGIGEKLQFVELPQAWILLARPDVSISTAKIFADPDLTRNTQRIKVRTVLERGGHNDCLAVVVKHYPEVARAMQLLSQYCQPRLTGTGSCIFGVFQNEADAVRVCTQLSGKLETYIARGMNHSSLHLALNSLER